MEKMDARKRYTQMVLKQSFLKLLKEKPVNRITVKEVCALAQLNRATFYAHYSDCFALMESIENELIDAFEKSLRYVNSFDVTALIEAIYDMVDQNQDGVPRPDFGEYKLNGPHADDCPGQGGQHCLLAERAAQCQRNRA